MPYFRKNAATEFPKTGEIIGTDHGTTEFPKTIEIIGTESMGCSNLLCAEREEINTYNALWVLSQLFRDRKYTFRASKHKF